MKNSSNTLKGISVSEDSIATATPEGPIYLSDFRSPRRERPYAIFGSILLIGELLGGTSAYTVPEVATHFVPVQDAWTSNGTIALRPKAPSVTSAVIAPSKPSLQASLLTLRDLSGLTWEQLARLFGVSRRAVHLWASGGRMNNPHAELLNVILATVRSIPAETSGQRRELLLAPRANGSSLYESWLAARDRHRGVNAPAFRPEQLIDALHDRSD